MSGVNSVVRATAHFARLRADGSAFSPSHNDRSAGVGSHVDKSRSELNRYIVWDIESRCARKLRSGESFSSHELSVYKSLFSESLESQNARYRARRQECRCLSMNEYRRRARSCPEELLLQIGDKNTDVSRFDLRRSINDFLAEFCSRYGSAVVPLSCALHFDEASNHCQFRYVYAAAGRDGLEVSQKRALASLGIERPDLESPEGRYNNAKVSFSESVRALWVECIERNTRFEINRVPAVPGKRSVELSAWQCARDEARAAEARSEVSELVSERDSLIRDVNSLDDEKARLTGILAPLRYAAGRVSDMLEKWKSVPVVGAIRDALDEFARSYDDARDDVSPCV